MRAELEKQTAEACDGGPASVKDGAGRAAQAVEDGARDAAESEQMTWVARAGVAAHGAVYLLLGAVALLVSGGESGQDVDQRGAFMELASNPFYMVYQGLTARFMEHYRPMPGPLEPVVRLLGRVGSLGRGIVVALAGGLVVAAAWTFDADKAKGIDLVFRELLRQPYGRPLAVAAAAALFAFGLYGLAEAVYRRV